MGKIITIQGRGAMSGIAEGVALVGETLQGNGALDYATGEIIQKGHSLKGQVLKGRILVIAGAGGSTAWSVRLHTTLVNRVGPAGMVFPKMDARTAGAAASMKIPVVTDLERDIFLFAITGDWIRVDGDNGTVRIIKPD